MNFNEFERDCLQAHNQFRVKHGSPPLSLDRGLCIYAKEWAETLARRNILQHRTNNRYGENIYMTMGRPNLRGGDAVSSWYAEVRDYKFGSGSAFDLKTGHFTQVVWKGSKRLGVAMTRSGDRIYVVANYDPPGNYDGEFSNNVLPAIRVHKLCAPQDCLYSVRYVEIMATVKRTVIIKKVSVSGAPNQPPPKPITISQADFEKACLEAHNKFRAMHGTPPLSINPNLTQVAAKWAQNLAKRQKMEHSPNGKYGENIYYSSGQQVTPDMPAKMWYDEIAKYDFAKSVFNPYTGHFTQLIWRDTKQVGVAYATSGEKVWVVANYDPPGNVNGFFKDNVPPKK
ncbi:PREDICTED: repressed by EFG1 protein 1-like [Bactrocera latifrons]|uniref:repressed by EFG1 protein 1-like n=1 Tax=Bactrocera latifrons TaxID=174628 RepID=UPI0008DCED15|nr:PREDICTED: repressed by EFG1 protein 1-like [Bactrocera latifrons]